MSAPVRHKFKTSALLSNLVSPEQVEQAERSIRAQNPSITGEIDDVLLASKLIDLELLTTYQVNQLKTGRTKLTLGPYIVTDWIGQGGMGQVFKAIHNVMGRESAVKVLPRNKATPETVSNFTREIRTQAQLDHPHLVRAYDAGHDGSVHYLVTEYVPGTDLRRLVRSRGLLTMQQSAQVIMQAALGLEHAHRRGLIHRDVKPGNILVTPEGVAKVSDLGLAGFLNEGENDPRAGKIVGTADYLSPEQIRTPREITHVSDIYSLGCTLYYAVCGKVPFPGGTPKDKARRHCEETPWHPRRFNPDVSEEFVEIIADMMEKNPAMRIQSAAEVAARLEPWAAEASPIVAQQLSKSRWMAPPPPSENEGDADPMVMGDMVIVDADDGDSRSSESPSQSSQLSQISQATDPVASGRHDTKIVRDGKRRVPSLSLGDHDVLARNMNVAVALAIAIPVAMLFGSLLTFVLMRLVG